MMWHFKKKYFYGHKCMVYRILSYMQPPTPLSSRLSWKKGLYSRSIFFLSSWHYDPTLYYSMNAIVFFLLLYWNLHTMYNYLYLSEQTPYYLLFYYWVSIKKQKKKQWRNTYYVIQKTQFFKCSIALQRFRKKLNNSKCFYSRLSTYKFYS